MSLYSVMDPNNCLRSGVKLSKNIYLFKILKTENISIIDFNIYYYNEYIYYIYEGFE